MAQPGESTRIHFKQSPVHIVAIILIAIAGLDLATGDTSKPILPAFIGDLLTQQIDLVILGIAAFMLLFIS